MVTTNSTQQSRDGVVNSVHSMNGPVSQNIKVNQGHYRDAMVSNGLDSTGKDQYIVSSTAQVIKQQHGGHPLDISSQAQVSSDSQSHAIDHADGLDVSTTILCRVKCTPLASLHVPRIYKS